MSPSTCLHGGARHPLANVMSVQGTIYIELSMVAHLYPPELKVTAHKQVLSESPLNFESTSTSDCTVIHIKHEFNWTQCQLPEQFEVRGEFLCRIEIKILYACACNTMAIQKQLTVHPLY